MPGPITHLWAGQQILKENPEIIPDGCVGAFFYGNFAPDLGYWPGGDVLWSELPHHVGSLTLVRRMVELSTTPAWKAFAIGWLLHVYLDLHGHPVINRIAARHYGDMKPRCSKRGLTAEENPVAHAKIETGLDLTFVSPKLIEEFETLCFPRLITLQSPVIQGFRDCYGAVLDLNALSRAIDRFPGLLSKGIRWQVRFNASSWGRAAGSVIVRLLRVLCRTDSGDLIAAFIKPDLPTKIECIAYRKAIIRGMEAWKDILRGVEPWPEEDPDLDTGFPTRRGESRLTDKLMDALIEKNSPEEIRQRFGEEAEHILCRWDKIRSGFEGDSGRFVACKNAALMSDLDE